MCTGVCLLTWDGTVCTGVRMFVDLGWYSVYWCTYVS